MQVYIEEIEEMSTHGITVYSLVQGMKAYRAEIRASGITIWKRKDYDQGEPLEEDTETYKELSAALTTELYKEQ